MGTEIERKWLITKESLAKNSNIRKEELEYLDIEQAYLCKAPVIRIRKAVNQDGKAEFVLCYKGKGLVEREEYNLPLTEEAYFSIRGKIEVRVNDKRR